jgi:hypothetical protein
LDLFWAIRESGHIVSNDSLLDRLDEKERDISKRFPAPIRFKAADFFHSIPNFNKTISASLLECKPSQDTCKDAFEDIPSVPVLSNPEEEKILSLDSHFLSFFGPGNTAAIYSTSNLNASTKCHRPFVRRSTCSVEKNVILTMAEGYSCNKVSLFLRSLRDTGSCAKVVIFRSGTPCSIESSCGDVEYYKKPKFPHIHMEVKRYVLFFQYLTDTLASFHACSKVLVVDFSDAFFQRDPFVAFDGVSDSTEVIITEEGYDQSGNRITLWTEPTEANKKWFMAVSLQLLGRDIISRVKDMPVLNSGVILGSFKGIYNLLWVFCYITDHLDVEGFLWSAVPAEKMDPKELSKWITGQGILNFIYYTGLLKAVAAVKILPPCRSMFINGCYYHPALFNASVQFHPVTNPLVNCRREPYAIVHQYNRFHMMVYVEEWLLQYGRLDWKFHDVGSPQSCS